MGNQMSDIIGRVGSIGAHDIETGGSPRHCVDQTEMTTTAGAAAAAGGGGGGGATDHQEEEANMEMAAITADNPHAGSEEKANTPLPTYLASSSPLIFCSPFPKFYISCTHPFRSRLCPCRGSRIRSRFLMMMMDEKVMMSALSPSVTISSRPLALQEEEKELMTDLLPAGQQSVQRKRDSGIFTSIGAATLSVAAAAVLRLKPRGLYSEDPLIVAAYTLDLITLLVLGILLFGLTFTLALIPDDWVPAVHAAATSVTAALLVLLLLLVAFVTYGLVRQ